MESVSSLTFHAANASFLLAFFLEGECAKRGRKK
jgi:hypothetical protein